jgi:hypothetical protein
LLVLYAACDEKALNPRGPEGPDFSITPMENEEAELLALQLSGEIMAPIPLYERIRSDLIKIRETWVDSIVYVNIKYTPYVKPSEITIGFASEWFDSAVAGTYHYWDSLNRFYPLDSIRFRPMSNVAILEFHGRLNSRVLVDEYAGLIGFDYVYAAGGPGDWSILLANADTDNLKYFFRFAFGDCPSGCTNSHYYYFTVEQDSANYHGCYFSTYPPDSARPNWMDTAIAAGREYFSSYFWQHEEI